VKPSSQRSSFSEWWMHSASTQVENGADQYSMDSSAWLIAAGSKPCQRISQRCRRFKQFPGRQPLLSMHAQVLGKLSGVRVRVNEGSQSFNQELPVEHERAEDQTRNLQSA
jgi:hypothetical protein